MADYTSNLKSLAASYPKDDTGNESLYRDHGGFSGFRLSDLARDPIADDWDGSGSGF